MKVLVQQDSQGKNFEFEYSSRDTDDKFGISEYVSYSDKHNKKHLQETIVALESALLYAKAILQNKTGIA